MWPKATKLDRVAIEVIKLKSHVLLLPFAVECGHVSQL